MKDEKTNKYFGYCIDLFDKLASICNFTYEISLIKKDENNSIKINKTNEENWNRIVNELIQKKADLSTPLTITSQREKLIDFTKPLMSLGISVPSLLIFIIAQISPYENKKKFTLFNTMWFTIGYLLR